MPTVSVVITTYHRPDFLMEAIASVQAQTYTDWELIVVSDGCTDDTEWRVRAVARRDLRVRLITQPNRGMAEGRNTGIRAARGELIAFLDDDDVWLPEKLARQVERFRRRPQLGVCFSRYHDLELETGQQTLKPAQPVRNLQELYHAGNILPSAALVRRRCFEAVGLFNPARLRFDDKEMWLRIARRFPIECVDAPLTVRRIGSYSYERQPSYQIGYFQQLRQVYEDFQLESGDGISAWQRRAQIAKYTFFLGWAYQQAGQWPQAAREYARALRTNPLVGFDARHELGLAWWQAIIRSWTLWARALGQRQTPCPQ